MDKMYETHFMTWKIYIYYIIDTFVWVSNLFLPWYSWKIAELALRNNRSHSLKFGSIYCLKWKDKAIFISQWQICSHIHCFVTISLKRNKIKLKNCVILYLPKKKILQFASTGNFFYNIFSSQSSGCQMGVTTYTGFTVHKNKPKEYYTPQSRAQVAQWVRSLDLTTRTSLSPIRRGLAPSFVNYKKVCTRLAAASDKVYQLLAQGRCFSPGTPASSTTKTGRHDIAEILLKVALKHQKSKSTTIQIDESTTNPLN